MDRASYKIVDTCDNCEFSVEISLTDITYCLPKFSKSACLTYKKWRDRCSKENRADPNGWCKDHKNVTSLRKSS